MGRDDFFMRDGLHLTGKGAAVLGCEFVRVINKGTGTVVVALLLFPVVRGEASIDTGRRFLFPLLHQSYPFHSFHMSSPFCWLLTSFLVRLSPQLPPSAPPFFTCRFFSLPQFFSPSYSRKLAVLLFFCHRHGF